MPETKVNNIIIEAICAFSDNYIWAIRSNDANQVALVDPGDGKVCIDYLEQQGLTLNSILVTHHHSDHVGGIKTLIDYADKQGWSITVYGPANENIPYLDEKLSEDDMVNLAMLNCQFTVLDVPGHTKGHIAFVNSSYNNKTNEEQNILFCGDTLFSGGCGRLFEGTAKQMYNSLSKLANLADNTLVYCAHEYTQANLNFALTVEPNNSDLQQYNTLVNTLRKQNKTTIPSSIGLEKQINPFLRCNDESIIRAANNYENTHSEHGLNEKTNDKNTSACEVFSTVRRWKDKF